MRTLCCQRESYTWDVVMGAYAWWMASVDEHSTPLSVIAGANKLRH